MVRQRGSERERENDKSKERGGDPSDSFGETC